MKKKWLLELADLLEKDANRKKGIKFDLKVFGESKLKPTVSCGTTACALGYAALIGFHGLKARVYEPTNCDPIWMITPIFKGEEDFDAAMKLFDIDYKETCWLFLPDAYTGRVTGKTGEMKVVKRLRDFANNRAAPPEDCCF